MVRACGWKRRSASASTPNAPKRRIATGAETIAIGCPFCRVMLSDGVAEVQSEVEREEQVQVVDVAQLLLKAAKNGATA